MSFVRFGIASVCIFATVGSVCAVETGADKSPTLVKLVNDASGKVLALDANSSSSGDQAIVATDSGGKAQQWRIEKLNGHFRLVSNLNNLALDVHNWSTDEGSIIIVWDKKSSSDLGDNQLWSWEGPDKTKPIRIKSKSSSLVLDVDGEKIVQRSADVQSKSQFWRAVDVKTPRYVKLLNMNSGKVLAPEDDGEFSGARAVLAADVDKKDKKSKSRQWKIENEENYYKLINRTSGLALDVSNNSTDEDNPVIVWDEKLATDGNDNQLWILVGGDSKDKPARLKSKLSGLVLDIDQEGKLVQRTAHDKAKSQWWMIVDLEE